MYTALTKTAQAHLDGIWISILQPFAGLSQIERSSPSQGHQRVKVLLLEAMPRVKLARPLKRLALLHQLWQQEWSTEGSTKEVSLHGMTKSGRVQESP